MKQILKRNWALDQEHKGIRQRIENEEQDLSTEKHIRSTSPLKNEIKNEKKTTPRNKKTVEKMWKHPPSLRGKDQRNRWRKRKKSLQTVKGSD